MNQRHYQPFVRAVRVHVCGRSARLSMQCQLTQTSSCRPFSSFVLGPYQTSLALLQAPTYTLLPPRVEGARTPPVGPSGACVYLPLRRNQSQMNGFWSGFSRCRNGRDGIVTR